MGIELTTDQLRATPLRLTDPQTRQEYVLVRAEVFDQLQGFLEDEDARLMYPGLASLDPEDWEDASHYNQTP